ncbi:oxygen-independent coproporphyrinogen III oxidase [Gimibacter soli]|uniref:Coproporphyrinogen-III oxidase n=1 Tax=Gimibacter soli TaxID=3024400 RepID=A0AAE9XVK8_9PROT|nr:oxygen-independent coproporphyrinogen III oxidase [Gimibacter soli]WCL55775.1 oxygen-independent coproporphyrinogen III oxidase [Gimibacter soli]
MPQTIDPIFQNFRHYNTARVPRYTSYPTAVQFHDGITADDQQRWLMEVGPDQSLSLYFHIPFCQQLCWYCGCNTTVTQNTGRMTRNTRALVMEIERVADLLPPKMAVRHLHFGGGTPTWLPMSDMAALVALVRKRFNLLPDAELAIEIDPRTMSRQKAGALAVMGFNRASLGVQDFNPAVQALINRIQPPQMVADCITWLRDAGIDAISMDLIYGLPGQTTEGLVETVRQAVRMKPQRVALFGYAHLPSRLKHQRMIANDALPGAEARQDAAEAAAAALVAAGYDAIGFDHFALLEDTLAVAAREGHLRRNFQGYTNDPADVLIGFGASAISELPGGYIQNSAHIGQYEAAIEAGGLAGDRGVAITADDRLRRAVIEALLCQFTADVGAICKAQGRAETALDSEILRLTPLRADGLCSVKGRTVTIPPVARNHARVVAATFDAYLVPEAARHSVAV